MDKRTISRLKLLRYALLDEKDAMDEAWNAADAADDRIADTINDAENARSEVRDAMDKVDKVANRIEGLADTVTAILKAEGGLTDGELEVTDEDENWASMPTEGNAPTDASVDAILASAKQALGKEDL